MIKTIVLLSLLLSAAAYADKSYSISRLDLSAQLYPDGSMKVTEARTYTFQGSFSFAFREFPLSTHVPFSDFGIEENGQVYHLSDDEEPGTFKITEEENRTEIRWFYRARDESRTFTFHYTAHNVIQRSQDAGVLYYQFISDEWDHSQHNIRISLSPPEEAGQPAVQAWLHGPLWAEYRVNQDGDVIAWCDHLPAHSFFEIRSLYPTELFPAVPQQEGVVRSAVQQEEAKWADEANARREQIKQESAAKAKRKAQGKWIAIALAGIGLARWYNLFQTFGKKPGYLPAAKMSPEIPDVTPPALVNYLLQNRQIGGSALTATLMDLAQRRFVSLHEEQVEQKRWGGGSKRKTIYYWQADRSEWRERSEELLPFESRLLSFLFDELAGGEDRLDVEQMAKKQTKMTSFFSKWVKLVKEHGDRLGWFDQASQHGMNVSLLTSGILLIATILLALYAGEWALIIGGATVVVFILSFFIVHRTREGETLARRWLALKRYLNKNNSLSQQAELLLPQISRYLVYGVMYGMGKQQIKNLAQLIPMDQYSGHLYWYSIHGGSYSADAFSESFATMVSTVSTATSSAAGSGGGASSGGGGGASSGGGGAG